jgi:holin-like protein
MEPPVLFAIAALLVFQLTGESLARGLGLTIPGPVIGLALLALALAPSRKLRQAIEPTASGLLRHLSLLFVPAAVGIVQHLPLLASEGLAIGTALVASTLAALIVTALTFRAVSRLLGLGEEG